MEHGLIDRMNLRKQAKAPTSSHDCCTVPFRTHIACRGKRIGVISLLPWCMRQHLGAFTVDVLLIAGYFTAGRLAETAAFKR